ncbi:transcription termination factor Rho, partial [Verminephrobacter aporrectodeae subsp. tuberculatae]|nr:transcription termination factor Rho [Verminephrobacter aporrectodeae subsp. tuberculatae]
MRPPARRSPLTCRPRTRRLTRPRSRPVCRRCSNPRPRPRLRPCSQTTARRLAGLPEPRCPQPGIRRRRPWVL